MLGFKLSGSFVTRLVLFNVRYRLIRFKSGVMGCVEGGVRVGCGRVLG